MPPVKCTDCNKSVTKKLPGIECSKCNKWRHADCAGISSDKFVLLANTECIDWVCRKCNKNPKRLSLILPDIEESPNTSEEEVIGKQQIIAMVRSEVTKILRTELGEIQASMQFSSDKIDEYEEKFSATEEIIKGLQSKLANAINNYHNLDLKYQAMEQRITMMEQEKLSATVEIAGIPMKPNEDVINIVKIISENIQASMEDVSSIKRVKKLSSISTGGGKDSGLDKSTILLTMKNEENRNAWINAGREANLINTTVDPSLKVERIYIREALTTPIRKLLWQAKQKLRSTFKFVWYKDGRILARKDEKSKVREIRNIMDIDRLLENKLGN